MMIPLHQAHPGQRVRIERLEGPVELVQRLLEFGLIEGEELQVLGFAPLGDPLEIQIGGARWSLRCRDAASVLVTPL